MTEKTPMAGREATTVAIENNNVSSEHDTDLSEEETKTRKAMLHAQRMRLHRRRRRIGMRSVRILVSPKQLESLIRKKYLDDKTRNNQAAIEEAVEWCVHDVLFESLKRNAK
jgi:hypothetical protein